MDCRALIDWFHQEKREFPWRIEPTPYRVWVSEVMLQQTQASVVIPYFEKWMERFPTIEELAKSPVEEVIKMWEGLGYYSRARNLHAGARTVWEKFGGVLPSSQENLALIKGLGPYSIGAIRSFAFHEKAPAVDGNVLRVTARYFGLEDDISKTSTQRKIRDRVMDLLPDEEHWIVNEALIELGATVCGKKPQCAACPLQKTCAGYRDGTAHALPRKSARTAITPLFRMVPVIMSDQHLLMRKGRKGEIMEDLYEFPFFETDEAGISSEELLYRIGEELALTPCLVTLLPIVSQSFTKYRVKLQPHVFRQEELTPVPGYEWISREDLRRAALSSGHRKILAHARAVWLAFD